MKSDIRDECFICTLYNVAILEKKQNETLHWNLPYSQFHST
jgi:hypothetical protein